MSFKINNFFNSTIMASFLSVKVIKKNKQTEKKYVFHCSLSQIHINPEKNKNEKTYDNDCLNLPIGEK